MHPYGIDSSERRTVPLIAGVLGVALAYALNRGLEVSALEIPWWLDAPAALGFAGLLYTVFDLWLWRQPLLRRLSLVRIPNLAGSWAGEGASSFDEHAEMRQVTLSIRQTWTHISIVLNASQSRSVSIVAALAMAAPEGPELTYTYRSEPTPDAVESMEMHNGTATLRLVAEDSLGGEYYSGRGRGTQGALSLRRD